VERSCWSWRLIVVHLAVIFGSTGALTALVCTPMIAPLMTTTPFIDVLQAARRGAVYADCLSSKPARDLATTDVGTDQAALGVDADSTNAGFAGTPSDVFPRLAAAVSGLDEVRYELEFGRDDQHRTLVHGFAQLRLSLPCHRCLLDQALSLRVAIDSALVLVGADVNEQAQRRELGYAIGSHDVVLIESSEVGLAQLLEDDLLLALPQRVCTKSACENIPPLSYPGRVGSDGQGLPPNAGDLGEADQMPTKRSPFDILKQLKRSDSRTGSDE